MNLKLAEATIVVDFTMWGPSLITTLEIIPYAEKQCFFFVVYVFFNVLLGNSLFYAVLFLWYLFNMYFAFHFMCTFYCCVLFIFDCYISWTPWKNRAILIMALKWAIHPIFSFFNPLSYRVYMYCIFLWYIGNKINQSIRGNADQGIV